MSSEFESGGAKTQVEREMELRITDAKHLAKESREIVNELREELREEKARRQALEQKVDELLERDELLTEAHRNAANTPTKRAIYLIRKLNNEAIANREKGHDATSQFTIREAQRQFQRDGVDLKRQLIYYAFEKAEDLVERPNVLNYVKEDRGSSKDSRLILDLDNGELPATVAGFGIDSHPVAADGGQSR